MIRRPPRSTRTDTPFPTRRSSGLRSILSLGMPPARAAIMAARRRAFIAGSGRPILAATVISRLSFENKAERFLSRSEEHTSELQSLMLISYAVFCLKKKKERHKHAAKVPHLHY